MKKFVLVLCVVFTAMLCRAQAENVFIGNGKANGAIVLEKGASKSEQRAARELARVLKIQTGVTVPVVDKPTVGNDIILGYSENARKAGFTLDGLSFDGFKIATKDGDLYIFGNDYKGSWPIYAKGSYFDVIHIYNKSLDLCAYGDAGTFHGVIYLLKHYRSCRWFMPGELGEIIPKIPDFKLENVNMKRSPAFEYRFLDFGLWDHNPDVAEWYALAGYGAPAPVRFEHSFYRFNYLRKDHPEYFALRKDGTRDNMPNGEKGTLCLSAPGLDRVFANAAADYFRRNPTQAVFPVMPNDTENICNCKACQAQIDYSLPNYSQASRYVWGFVNRVAKLVAEKCPGKMVGCCAYANYMTVPKDMKIEPNVAVMQTTAMPWRFNDFYRWRNDVNLYEWSRITSNLYTWDYYCWDLTNRHLTGLPILVARWMADDMKKRNGHSKGMFLSCRLNDGNYPINGKYLMAYPQFNHLNIYLAGELQWDPTQSLDALLDDYYSKFYGPAAPEMKKFWSYAEEIWCNMNVKDRSLTADLQKTLYTPEVLKKLKSHLEAAQKKLDPASPESKRVKIIQDHFYTYVDRVDGTRSKRPVHTVKRIAPSEAPSIDGKREAVWRKANLMSFVNNFDSKTPKCATSVRTLHDGTNLYIFVTAFENLPEKIRSRERKRDDVEFPYFWDDDAMEFFFLPDNRKPGTFYQIVTNARGNTVIDLKSNSKDRSAHDFSWTSSFRYKTGTEPGAWTLEMAIPLKELELTEQPGINVGRDRQPDGAIERSAWAPTFTEGWGMAPYRAGNLVMEK